MEAKLVLPKVGKPQTKIIAAKFEHGYLKKGSAKNLDFQYGRNEDGKRTLTLPGKEKLSYVGEERKDEGFSYYFGLLNKKTGKMTVHDAEIFRMRPKFEDEKKAEFLFEDSLTYGQQVDRLNATFGSTKKKRAVSSRQKFNELYGENYNVAMDTAIEHAVSQAKDMDMTDSPQTPTAASGRDGFFPPNNPEAETPAGVYTAEQLISPIAMTALKSPAEIFFKRTKEQLTEWTDTHEYCWYVLENLKAMPSNDHMRWQKAKCLIYMQYMLKLYRLKPADFKKNNCLPVEWPDAVKKDLLYQFTAKSVADKGQRPVRYFPARLKDKLLLYILAMSLVVEDAQVDPRLLLQDLAEPERKVSQFYRALGCTVSSKQTSLKKIEAGEPTVTLKLPLKLPSLSRAVGKDNRKKRNIRA